MFRRQQKCRKIVSALMMLSAKFSSALGERKWWGPFDCQMIGDPPTETFINVNSGKPLGTIAEVEDIQAKADQIFRTALEQQSISALSQKDGQCWKLSSTVWQAWRWMRSSHTGRLDHCLGLIDIPADIRDFEGKAVFFDRTAFEAWIDAWSKPSVRHHSYSERSSTECPPSKGMTGRPVGYDWDSFTKEARKVVDYEGWPFPGAGEGWTTEADLIRKMQEWCSITWDQEPSVTSIKRQISKLKSEVQKSKNNL